MVGNDNRVPRLPSLPTASTQVRWLKPDEAKRLLEFLDPRMQAVSEGFVTKEAFEDTGYWFILDNILCCHCGAREWN